MQIETKPVPGGMLITASDGPIKTSFAIALEDESAVMEMLIEGFAEARAAQEENEDANRNDR